MGFSTCRGELAPENGRAECFRSDPVTTAGEAVAVEAIARERGWESVLVVTNRPHTPRAWWTFKLCTGLDVMMNPIDRVEWTWLPLHVSREVAGTVKNLIQGCPPTPVDVEQSGVIR